MTDDAAKRKGYEYLAACDRVTGHAVRLIEARGVAVSVDIDPVNSSPYLAIHHIQLTHGRATRTIAVDHDTFMDDEFFRTLVLHQIEAAIGELTSVVDRS
jgi:hypothetical protein